jgi:arabinan endo-1,5-alpha-L-arabinosidase
MKIMKKSFVAFLTLALLMFGSVTACFADEDGVASEEGVNVTVTTDADSYGTGDTVKMTITVENTNSYDINSVTVQAMNLPDGLSAVSADALTISNLAAGATQTVEKEFTVTATGVASTASSSGSDDNTVLFIAIGVAVVVVILIIILLIAKKKKGKKVVASMIALTLIASSVAGISIANPVVAQAAATTTHVSVHDPSIVKDTTTGTYYVFGSHRAWAKSTDLMNWSTITLNLTTDYKNILGDVWNNYCYTENNTTIDGNMWAPDVIYNETMGKWCMYMSLNGDNWQSIISLLTADSIEGPYEYVGDVVYSGFTGNSSSGSTFNVFKNVKVGDDTLRVRLQVGVTVGASRVDSTDVYKVLGEDADLSKYAQTQSISNNSMLNAIDPNVQYDDDGNLWMTYGSWSAGIYQLKLDTTTGLRDYTQTYETVENESDAYFGYKIAGGYYCSGEGAYLLKMDKYYFLFLSYAGLSAQEGYQMRVFRSENINGPYVDANGVSAIYKSWSDNKLNGIGYRIMSSVDWTSVGMNKIEVAQGHNSAFVDEDGKAYLVYHTRFANNTPEEGHEVRVHQLWLNDEGWLVAAPFEYTGETLPESGYSADEIAGDYAFAIHTPGQYYHKSGDTTMGVITPQNITLTADGQITGDVTGTWTVDGTSVTFNIDGKTYNGVAIKQATEKAPRDEKMCITMEGDNRAVWAIAK